MSDNLAQDNARKSHLGGSKILQLLAISILVLWVVEVASGASWTSGYSFGVAATHVGVGVVMVAVTALALAVSLRLPGLRRRIAAGVSLGSTLGAAVAGAVYIYGGKSPAADASMGGLTLLVLIGVILLLVWAFVSKPNSSATAA